MDNYTNYMSLLALLMLQASRITISQLILKSCLNNCDVQRTVVNITVATYIKKYFYVYVSCFEGSKTIVNTQSLR